MDLTRIVKALFHLTRKSKWILGGLWARLTMRGLGVEYGPGLVIGSAPYIHRTSGAVIRLGRDVTIYNCLEENPAGVAHRTVLSAGRHGARLIIGDNVGISGAILYAWKEIQIGDNVNIGAGAAIYDTDFHPLDLESRLRNDHSKTKVAPVIIGPGVWLGARSMVLKGVSIGEGVVVAAGAIVTQNVPPWSIVAGVPAKVVGSVNPAALSPQDTI